jgi:hypothetical protein
MPRFAVATKFQNVIVLEGTRPKAKFSAGKSGELSLPLGVGDNAQVRS